MHARAGGRRGGAVRWGAGTRAKEGGARPEAGTEPGDGVEQAIVGPQSTALAGEQQQRCGARSVPATEAEGKGRGAHSEPAGVRERARGGLAGANRWRRCRRPQVDDEDGDGAM